MRKICLLVVALGCAGGETPALLTCHQDADCGAQAFCRDSICLLDDAAPELALRTAAQAALVTDASIRIEGTAGDGDGSGIARIEYSFDGTQFLPAAWQAAPFAFPVEVPAVDNAAVTLYVRATDRMGNTSEQTLELRVDRVGPHLTVTQPPKSCYGLAEIGQTIDLAFAARDGDRVVSLELSTDGGASWRGGSVAEGMRWTHTVGAAPVADQRLRVLARAKDAAGNSTQLATELTIDTEAPSLVVSEPAEGAILTAETATLRAKVLDPNIEELAYSLEGQSPLVAAPASESFEAPLPVPDEDWVSRSLRVSARDRCGNETTQTIALQVDRRPPQLVIYSPDDGSLARPSTPSLRLAGRAVDGALQSLTWRVGDAAPVGLPAAFDTLFAPPPADYTEHVLTLEARDAAGHVTVQQRRVAADFRPPALYITNLPAGTVLNTSTPAPFEVQGTVSDGDLERVEYSRDGAEFVPTDAPPADGTYAFPLFLSDFENAGVVHTLQVAAVDRAGNRTVKATTYQNDRIGPLIEIVKPAPDAACLDTCTGAVYGLASPAQIELRGILRLDPGDAVQGPRIVRREATGETATLATTESSGAWTATWTPPMPYDGEFLTVETSARDGAGNETRATRRLYIDRIRPSVTSPARGRVVVPERDPAVEFSEPISRTSLQAAFVPPHEALELQSPDGRRFYFAAPDQVQPAAVYSLVISAAADRAGNALPYPVHLEFRTAPERPPAQSVLPHAAEQPLLALDGEDLPWVLHLRPAPHEEVALARWDGAAGRWTDVAFGMPLLNGSLEHFEIRSQPTADGTGFVHAATALYLSRGAGRQTWFAVDGLVDRPGVWTGSGPDVIAPGVFRKDRAECSVDCEGLRDQWVLAMETAEVLGWSHVQRPDLHGTVELPWPVRAGRGPALVLGDYLYYAMTEYTGLRVHAAARDLAVGGVHPSLQGPVHLAAAASGGLDGAAAGPTLTLVCTQYLLPGGLWFPSENLHPEAGLANAATVRGIRLASNAQVLGIALDTSDGAVHVGVLEDATCAVAPGPVRWLTKRTNARDSSVAVDSRGGLWFAYVNASAQVVVEQAAR